MVSKGSSNNIQKLVEEFVKHHKLETPPAYRLLDLAAELGELSKELLKGSDYGRSSFTPPTEWQAELGDVYFSLICLANSTDIDLVVALEGAVEKYSHRLAAGGEAGSGC